MIYLGNPTYCLLLQDRTDYWAYSSGHFDLTLRLFLLVIKPWSVQYSSTPVKRGILTKHIWLKNLNACKGTLQDGPLVKTLRMKTDWNPWNYRRWFSAESFLVWFSFLSSLKDTVNANDYISFSNRQSRKSHQVKLCKPFCPTDIFKYSFWHRNIDTWNSLPSSLVELDSMNAFKKVLKSTLFY